MKKIKLYDYQQKMLEEIINVLTTKEITRYRKKKGYEEGNSVVMQMPTVTDLRDDFGGEMVSG